MSKEKKYYDTDPEKIQKALAEIGQGDFFKPKEGKNVIRILPPWSKKGVWYKEATIHYGVLHEGKERGYTCLKQFDKECPICEKRNDLLKGDSEEREIADKLRPRLKYYANVLDRNTGRVMVWGFTSKTLGILLGYEADPDHCNNKLTDPEEGFDVVIERQGTGRTDTKYNIRVKPKSSEIGDDSDWEDKMKNLDDIVEEPDEEKIQESLSGMFGKSTKKHSDDDDDDDDEDKEKKHKKDEDEDDSSEIKKGDKVSFEEDNEDYEGKVIKVNEEKGTALVVDEDGDEHKVDLEDLEKIEKEDKEEKDDDDEDKKSKSSKKKDEDDDEKDDGDDDEEDEKEARRKRKERREKRKHKK